MEPISFGLIVLILLVLMFAYKAALAIFKLVNRVIDGIISAPGKGIRKIFNYFKGAKLTRLNKKLAKEVMKEDHKARLNTALSNPSYLATKKAKKLTNKIEAIELKNK